MKKLTFASLLLVGVALTTSLTSGCYTQLAVREDEPEAVAVPVPSPTADPGPIIVYVPVPVPLLPPPDPLPVAGAPAPTAGTQSNRQVRDIGSHRTDSGANETSRASGSTRGGR